MQCGNPPPVIQLHEGKASFVGLDLRGDGTDEARKQVTLGQRRGGGTVRDLDNTGLNQSHYLGHAPLKPHLSLMYVCMYVYIPIA